MLNNKKGGSRWHGSSSKINSHINNITELAKALACIPADLTRDEWVKIAAAWKSADGDFASWDEWSRSAANYDAKDAKNVWKSLTSNGGIGPRTLFYIARQYGYVGDGKIPDQLLHMESNSHTATLDEQLAINEKKYAVARVKAESILNACSIASCDHSYLKTKRIKPCLMPWLDQWQRLVLPISDLQGNLHSLQFISPKGEKQFLSGGAVKTHFHQIWSGDQGFVICEGYATGVTLYRHYVPDYSVVVAFNAGNLKPVAEVFRKAFSDSQIVIAGDRDKSGAGQQAAEEAALAVNGKLSIPPFLQSEAGSDWNDFWVNQLGEVAA